MSGERPGLMLERLLRQERRQDYPSILAFLEQRAKRQGDLGQLRAIKDFRRMLAEQASLTQPPRSA